jgi:hypothetical protein
MATPADQRLLELMEKWLKSLELHARYSSLDDVSYSKIQPWTPHQRPSRWIIDLAMQKTVALRTQIEERVKSGDEQFSDSLELMIFLANLVGSEHIERFIPLAEAANELPAEAAPQARPAAEANTATATREMPNFVAAKRAPPLAGTAQVARTERKAAAASKPAARPPAKPSHRAVGKTAARVAPPERPPPERPPAAEREAASEAARAQVIADAARLVQWGRKWFELPELIARMADRPSLPEVRRILKENKSAIDARVGNA